jgi:preprotein translocase subunit SecE
LNINRFCFERYQGDRVAKKEAEKKESSRKAQADQLSGVNAVAFLQGTKEELAKVVWPSRQQLISESAAVILMVSLSATLIYLIDQLFGWASRQVF